jgi:hypothetical protein
MDVINPYELLGFDSKTPNIEMKELKKQYYMLSLICHPDKGGNSSDMIILKNCYEYVKEQIERKDEKSRDYEEVAMEFKEFMKTQSQEPPPFSQVYEEAHIWLKEFNDKFNNLKMNDVNHRNVNININVDNDVDEELNYFSIDTSGYGHMMDKSENDNGFSLDDIEFMRVNRDKEVIEKPNVEFTTIITTYKEPISFNGIDFGTMGNLKKTKVNDFTTRMGNNILSDYKQAFSSPQPQQQQENELNANVMGRYEQLLEEREAMDKLLFEENNNNKNKSKKLNLSN